MNTIDTLPSTSRPREFLDLWEGVISQFLGRLVGKKVTAEILAGEGAPGAASGEDENSVWIRFAIGSAGEQAFLLDGRDATRLAQLAGGGTAGRDTVPRLDGRRTVEGLLTGIAGKIRLPDWLGPDAAVKVIGTERPEWESAFRATLRFSTSQGPLLALEARISTELASALEPAGEPEKEPPPAPDPEASSSASALDEPPQSSEPTENEILTAPGPEVFPAAPEDSLTVPPVVRNNRLELLMDVELEVVLRFGQREMLLHDVLTLTPGTVLELDQHVQDPVELLVGNKVIAWGEVVAVDGDYGLRITSLASRKERLESLRK